MKTSERRGTASVPRGTLQEETVFEGVFWLCDEAKHFRRMELALNGVDWRANNCFDLNRVPHLGEQMNAEQPRP